MTVDRILFVCLGNICRSAMAEGVMRAELARRNFGHVTVDSAGTGAWHVGNPPDPRAIAAARRRGIDISGQRARQVTADDFEMFNLLAAMDASNLMTLRAGTEERHRPKVRLFLDFCRDLPIREVADPYYGDETGFEDVLDLLQIGARSLADYVEFSSS